MVILCLNLHGPFLGEGPTFDFEGQPSDDSRDHGPRSSPSWLLTSKADVLTRPRPEADISIKPGARRMSALKSRPSRAFPFIPMSVTVAVKKAIGGEK
jgi:hypothetical protein